MFARYSSAGFYIPMMMWPSGIVKTYLFIILISLPGRPDKQSSRPLQFESSLNTLDKDLNPGNDPVNPC
jgi:hypothetical protein